MGQLHKEVINQSSINNERNENCTRRKIYGTNEAFTAKKKAGCALVRGQSIIYD